MKLPIGIIHKWYRGLLQHPKYRVWVVLASLLYLISPIDLAPDAIPLLGWIDDTAILSLLVAEMAQLAKTKLQQQNNLRTKASPTDTPVVDVVATEA
jgi:uncharacterized membrane protein YkvA (DUF1232 family)